MKICNIVTNDKSRFFQSYFSDGGIDIILNKDILIPANSTIHEEMDLMIKVSDSFFMSIVMRSSISKKGIISSNSLIDANYDNSISLILHNVSNESCFFKKGERICSIVAHERIPVKIHENNRGKKGSGSSGI